MRKVLEVPQHTLAVHDFAHGKPARAGVIED